MAGKSFTFCFADIEVREREFSLVKAGEVLPVEPKAFRVLLILLRNPQKLLPKEELLTAVWGETAVSENSLARSIALLRRLLGDEARDPRFIETVATVGYRWLCKVDAAEDSHGGVVAGESGGPAPSHQRAADEAHSATARASLTPRRRWLAGAVVVAVVLASAFWYLRRSLPLPHVTEYRQITHDGHRKDLVGTDGSRLYFTRWFDPGPIAEVSISGGEIGAIPVELPDPRMEDVSQDGSSLLIRSREGEQTSLWSVQIPGNSLRHLADGSVASAAWSPDGKSVVYSALNGEIDVIRSDGSEARRLAAPKDRNKGAFSLDLAWSPDGRTIRFTWDNKFWEISADGSGLHPLLPGWRPEFRQCCGRWTPDGRFFEFLVQDNLYIPSANVPGNQIWAFEERSGLLHRAHGSPFQLTSGPIRWGLPVPSKDGNRIFARGVTLRGELDRFDPNTHQIQPYLGGISAEFTSFSPDGQSLVYVTYPEGILYRANRDGTNPLRLTDPPMYPAVPRWSPDGAELAFNAIDSTGRDQAYLIPSKGGIPQLLLPNDKGFQLDPNWSPDGRKIIFHTSETADAPSREILRILDISSGKITDVPGSQGKWSPRWSPDGRFLAALTYGSASLAIFNFKTQQWSVIQKGELGYPTFSSDGRFLYFLRPVDNRGVYRIPVSGGKAEQVVDLKGVRLTSYYNYFMGMDPDDTPLVLRDVGTDDLYALTLEMK